MDKLEKIYMFKNSRDLDEVNDIYMMIKEKGDYYIFKKYDTVTNEEKEVVALEKEYVKDNLYTAKDFFSNASYVGKSGFYKDMCGLEKEMSKTFILVYKDEYNDILYDELLGSFFVAPSVYSLEEFVIYDKQKHNVRFKKGLGKK